MRKLEIRQIGPHCILSCLYFLLLPTTIAINSAGNSILKLATIPIGLFFLITLLLSDRKLQINAVHLSLLFFTLTVVATLFFDNNATSKSFVIGYILNAAIYVCMTVMPYNKCELELLENVQILLLIVLNAITWISGGSEDNRATLMIMGQTSDPNFFIGFFIFPIAVALKKMVSDKYGILYLLLIGASFYSVFLSGSRGGLLAVAVTLAGFAIIYPSKTATRLKLLVGGAVLILVFWFVFKPLLPENIIERMSVEDVVESGGTGRIEIWQSMLREIVEQPEKLLFGRGINATHTMFIKGSWGTVFAHNQLIQTLYNQGAVGLLAFLAMTGISFFRCVKQRKTVAIAILGMMALSLSLSFNQTTRTFWNLIAYAAFVFPDSDTDPMKDGGLSDHERT